MLRGAMRNLVYIVISNLIGTIPLFSVNAEPIVETYIAGNAWNELQWPLNFEEIIVTDLMHNNVEIEYIGEVLRIGTTFHDLAGVGSLGRMILAQDDSIYVTWTSLLPSDWSKIGYNAYFPGIGWLADSLGLQFGPTGRIAYCNMDLLRTENHHYPIISSSLYDGLSHILLTHLFEETAEYNILNNGRLYSQIVSDREENIHVLFANSEGFSSLLPLIYQRSDDAGENFTPEHVVDSIFTISHVLAKSRYSSKAAIAYLKPRNYDPSSTIQMNNDLAILESEDGIEWHWEEIRNLTNFADVDTFRAGFDVGLIYDDNDNLHAVFSTPGVFYDPENGDYTVLKNSLIWHWSSAHDSFTVIAKQWEPSDNSAWHLSVDRGSLSLDSLSGYMYCVYNRFTENDISMEGYSNGEIFVSVSTDHGLNWSQGTNVTQTNNNGCYPGECFSEVFPSAVELISDTLQITYILDRDAGSVIQMEGMITVNPVMYQRIPCSEIPTTPLIEQNVSLHVTPTEISEEWRQPLAKFAINSIYPNPFNKSAIIEFNVSIEMHVELQIYDIMGNSINNLINKRLAPGRHRVIWNGKGINGKEVASGVYIISLRSGLLYSYKKAILLK